MKNPVNIPMMMPISKSLSLRGILQINAKDPNPKNTIGIKSMNGSKDELAISIVILYITSCANINVKKLP